MKSCVKCRSDLPKSANHCVYCGEKQPERDPQADPETPSSTMMGYPGMAADVLKQAQEARGVGVTPEPVYTEHDEPPTLKRHVGPHHGPGSMPQSHDKKTVALQPGAISGAPPPRQPTPQPIGERKMLEPVTVKEPPGAAADLAPPGMPGAPSPAAYPNVPLPYQDDGSAPGIPPYQGPPPGMVGLGGGYAGPPPGMGRAADPARPPYLASETDGRAHGPIEPWHHTLKTLLLVFGVLLAACFVAPWAVSGSQTSFSWSLLSAPGLVTKLQPLLLAGSAILGIVFALTPLSTGGRGLAAGLLALACLHALAVVAIVEGGITGRGALEFGLAVAATFALIPGLLLRSAYRASSFARILTTIGVLCALGPLLIPAGGSLPIVGMFRAVIAAPGEIGVLVTVIYVVITALGLLVWLPRSSGAGAAVIAWLLIFQPIATAWASTFAGGIDVDAMKANLAVVFYIPLAHVAWLTLSGHGLASFFGKRLESP